MVSAPTGGIRKLRLDELTRDVIIENNTIYGGGYPRGFIIEGQVKE
ncbi:MAG: hypothetical protein Q4B28_03065 [bacterium]|nr:hypothetical protein [bacterium]